MKSKEYILFDLDGTLTDSSIGIINSVVYALKKFSIEETDLLKLKKFIGPPLIDSFMKYYGFSKPKAIKAVEYYREYYSVKGIFENRLYDGIKELLEELYKENKKIILATSKPEGFANEILKHFGINRYFSFVGGATMNESRTEKDEVLEYILKECNINPQTAAMVGDRKYDIIGAHSFNIRAIGVLFGFGSRNELENANADYIVKTVYDLREILLG